MRFRLVPIDERGILQDLVARQINGIQGGIRVFEKEAPADSGPVIVGIDSDGRPVFVWPILNRGEEILSRLILLYGWVLRSMPLLAKFYEREGWSRASAPRIIAVAPEFSRNSLDGASHLSFSVEFYLWRGLEINGEVNVLLEPVGGHPSPEPVPVIARPNNGLAGISRLTDEEIRFFEQNALIDARD
jgi:hypothetical protein